MRSRFKGVVEDRGGWRAHFYVTRWNHFTIGTYPTEQEAADAYDQFALQHGGADTFLNFRDLRQPAEPVLLEDRVLLPLLSGGHCIVDLADLNRVIGKSWIRYRSTVATDGMTLHQALLGKIPYRHTVAHINGDLLDFRRDNLELTAWEVHTGGRGKPSKKPDNLRMMPCRRQAA